MNGEIRPRDIAVDRLYRARCQLGGCRWRGEPFPDYAGAVDDGEAHRRDHGNQDLQQWHDEARQVVARLTLADRLLGRRGTR